MIEVKILFEQENGKTIKDILQNIPQDTYFIIKTQEANINLFTVISYNVLLQKILKNFVKNLQSILIINYMKAI